MMTAAVSLIAAYSGIRDTIRHQQYRQRLK
jgi:hypothetical protein